MLSPQTSDGIYAYMRQTFFESDVRTYYLFGLSTTENSGKLSSSLVAPRLCTITPAAASSIMHIPGTSYKYVHCMRIYVYGGCADTCMYSCTVRADDTLIYLLVVCTVRTVCAYAN